MNVKILIFLLPLIAITTQRVIPEVTTTPALIETSSKIDLELQPGPLEFLDLKNSSNKDHTTQAVVATIKRRSVEEDESEVLTLQEKLFKDLVEFENFWNLEHNSDEDNTTNVPIKGRSIDEGQNEIQTLQNKLFSKELAEFEDFWNFQNSTNEDNTTNAAVAIKRRSVEEDELSEAEVHQNRIKKNLAELADFGVRLWRFLKSLISHDNFYLLRRVLSYVSNMSDFMVNYMPEHPQDEALGVQDVTTSSKPPPADIDTVRDYYSIEENLIETEDRSSGANDAKFDKIEELRFRFVHHLAYLPRILGEYFGYKPTDFTGIDPLPDYQL